MKTHLRKFLLIAALAYGASPIAVANDEHAEKAKEHHEHGKDEHEESEHKEADHHEHEKEEHGDHAEAGEHGEHGEGAASVGPDKGILEKGPLGFRLSPEALKTIGPKTAPYSAAAIPCEAVVSVKDGKFVFRSRDGWFKKVPIAVLSKTNGSCSVRTEELKSGDQIVTSQSGFLRIAEVLLEEGASHSH